MDKSYLTLEKQLKELILDDDFNSLQALVTKEVNLMEILKVAHKELPHSNFLAWLFDPNANHQLGDIPLKEFIKIYFKENDFQNLGTVSQLSVFDFVNMQRLDDLEVKREYKNIDLILSSKTEKLCIVIENKIYARESTGQLKKYREIIEEEYRDYKRLYIYLSLEEQDISDRKYIQLNYDHIIKLITHLLSLNISDMVKFTLQQYLNTLNSMCNKDEDIERIAQQLYRKYKSAFDLVFKYTGSELDKIREYLHELIRSHDALKPFHSSKSHIRFQPKWLYSNEEKLRSSMLLSDKVALKDDWTFLFEFEIRKHKLSFDFKIGTCNGNEYARDQLFRAFKNSNTHAHKSLDKPTKWHSIKHVDILNQTDLESTEIPFEPIKSKFNEIINTEVKKIIEVLE